MAGFFQKIQSGIQGDIQFRWLTWEGQWMYYTLLTSSSLNEFGAICSTVLGLVDRLQKMPDGTKRFSRHQAFKALQQLVNSGFVRYDDVAAFIVLPGYLDSNIRLTRAAFKSWPAKFLELPGCDLKAEIAKELGTYGDRVPKALKADFNKAIKDIVAGKANLSTTAVQEDSTDDLEAESLEDDQDQESSDSDGSEKRSKDPDFQISEEGISPKKKIQKQMQIQIETQTKVGDASSSSLAGGPVVPDPKLMLSPAGSAGRSVAREVKALACDGSPASRLANQLFTSLDRPPDHRGEVLASWVARFQTLITEKKLDTDDTLRMIVWATEEDSSLPRKFRSAPDPVDYLTAEYLNVVSQWGGYKHRHGMSEKSSRASTKEEEYEGYAKEHEKELAQLRIEIAEQEATNETLYQERLASGWKPPVLDEDD